MKNKITALLLMAMSSSSLNSQITQQPNRNLNDGKLNPIEINQIKVNDIRDYIKPNNRVLAGVYFENTSKVIPPNSTWPYGLVVVTTGQPRPSSSILLRPLFPDNVPAAEKVAQNKAVLFSDLLGANSKAHTDNQTVKLPNGDILISKDHCTWDPVTVDAPEWINESIKGEGGFHKGNRAATSFFIIRKNGPKPNDPKKGPVEYLSTIDFGKFEKGKYGYPQTLTDAGTYFWIGGHDRHELYACPYTGNIYFSFRYVSGAYKSHSEESGTMILVSRNSGKTWELLKKFPYTPNEGIWAPMVMTSTPNKRLIVFSGFGSEEKPRVYYSKAGSFGTNTFYGPFYLDVKDEKNNNIKFQYNKDNIALSQNTAYFPSLYPVSTSKTSGESEVFASVHMRNSTNQLEAKIISIKIKDDNTTPVPSFITTIKAASSKDHSVVYGSFINTDTWETTSPNATISVFYWLEAPDKSATEKKYAARCVSFFKNKMSFPTYLSVKDGTTEGRSWTGQADPGDYLSGGFYFHNNSYNYFAQWLEPDGLKSNTVSFTFSKVSVIMANGFQ